MIKLIAQTIPLILIMGMTASYGSDSNNILNSLDDINIEKLKVADPCKALELLSKYENDPCWPIRRLAHLYEVKLADFQPTKEVRQEVTNRLVIALLDPNSGLSGDACLWLLTFKENDYSIESKTRIKNALLTKERPGVALIKVAGVANIKETLPSLGKLLINEEAYRNDPNNYQQWHFTVSWNARLARARMGVKADIERCIKLVESDKTRGIGALTPLNDIGYIRQPEAIDFLMTYAFSDETIGQVKPTALGEPVASYVIDILADCLENFPIEKRKGRGYKPEEIELCRKWMSEQKEWKIIR